MSGCCLKLRGKVYGRQAASLQAFAPLGNIGALEIKPVYSQVNLSARSRLRGCGSMLLTGFAISFDLLSWTGTGLRLAAAAHETGEDEVENYAHQLDHAGPGVYPIPLLDSPVVEFLDGAGSWQPLTNDVYTIDGGMLSLHTNFHKLRVRGTKVKVACTAIAASRGCDTQLRVDAVDCFSKKRVIVDVWRAQLLADAQPIIVDSLQGFNIAGKLVRDEVNCEFPYYRMALEC